jgi:hypothetical protein
LAVRYSSSSSIGRIEDENEDEEEEEEEDDWDENGLGC